MAEPLNMVWMVFWAFALVMSLPISAAAAAFYIGLYVFVPCLPHATKATKMLNKGMLIPYYASDNFMQGRSPVEGFHHAWETAPPS